MLFLLARPSYAFGAGNIASTARVEGQNWRHGDIEDTLLTILISRAAGGKKFSKMDVKRTYFGNWLRDYSQAIDVGTVKMVSAEAIRILVSHTCQTSNGRCPLFWRTETSANFTTSGIRSLTSS